VEDLESQIAETPKPRDPIQQVDFLTSANDATASSRLLTLRLYRIFQRPLELSRHGLEGSRQLLCSRDDFQGLGRIKEEAV
jgi:hypothetical protein